MNTITFIVTITFAVMLLEMYFKSRRKRKYQQEQQKDRFLLAKLNEIQDILYQYRQAYTDSTLEIISAYSIGLQQKQDSIKVPDKRLQTLVHFYAPELTDSLTKLEKSCENYGNVLAHCVGLEMQTADTKKNILRGLYKEQLNLYQTIADMKAEVIALSRNRLYFDTQRSSL